MSRFSNYILLIIFICLGLDSYSQSSPSLGDSYQGGIVFYLDGNGGGLIAAPSDIGTASWGCLELIYWLMSCVGTGLRIPI